MNKILTTSNLPENGPYKAESTFEILSKIYNCQFIIFTRIASISDILAFVKVTNCLFKNLSRPEIFQNIFSKTKTKE